MTRSRCHRRAFSLLEVLVALAILVVSLTILVETQASSALITVEAERVITAADLASAKMNEAMLRVEEDGFQTSDIHESGDFDDFGDDALNMDVRDELEDYHWEYDISEVDFQMAGDLAGMFGNLQSSGAIGGAAPEGAPSLASLGAGGNPLEALGMSPDAIGEMLAPYIREIRVRVWWGKDSESAEKRGDEVIVVTHLVNPSGILAMDPSQMGAGGGGSP